MSTEIERRDRELISRLEEAGVRPWSAAGLTYRLLTIDALSHAEVARVLLCDLSTIYRRADRVRAQLAGTAVPDDWEDPEADPLLEEARALLDAIRNTSATGGSRENPCRCGPLVTLGDCRNVIAQAAAARNI